MNKTPQQIKNEVDIENYLKGLGILLIVMGVSMNSNLWDSLHTWKDFISLVVSIFGWMIYAFSNRMANLK